MYSLGNRHLVCNCAILINDLWKLTNWLQRKLEKCNEYETKGWLLMCLFSTYKDIMKCKRNKNISSNHYIYKETGLNFGVLEAWKVQWYNLILSLPSKNWIKKTATNSKDCKVRHAILFLFWRFYAFKWPRNTHKLTRLK